MQKSWQDFRHRIKSGENHQQNHTDNFKFKHSFVYKFNRGQHRIRTCSLMRVMHAL